MKILYSELKQADEKIKPILRAVKDVGFQKINMIMLSPGLETLFARSGRLKERKSPAGPLLQVGLWKFPVRVQQNTTGWDLWIEIEAGS